jgi:molecular chaperone HscB
MDCNTVQKMVDCNYFDIFQLKHTYSIDLSHLDSLYKRIQSKVHPDKYTLKTDNEKTVSLESSTTVNQAYRTLKDPIHRAMYLLSLNNINVFDEGTSYTNPQLMVRIHVVGNRVDYPTYADLTLYCID